MTLSALENASRPFRFPLEILLGRIVLREPICFVAEKPSLFQCLGFFSSGLKRARSLESFGCRLIQLEGILIKRFRAPLHFSRTARCILNAK